MRAFAAIELDARSRGDVDVLIRSLPSGVRWSSPEQLHVTLRFFGEVPDADVPRIAEVVQSASRQVAPFPLRIDGLGAFPNPRSPRVLWIGVDDPQDGCARWLRHADPPLAELGYPPEARAFHAHVTLGRAKSPAESRVLVEALNTAGVKPLRGMTADHVTLLESRLTPRGSIYRCVLRAPLGGPPLAPVGCGSNEGA